ncbi:hypothetical protein ACWIUD_02660 [Helicobacter sp. 23-1044]
MMRFCVILLFVPLFAINFEYSKVYNLANDEFSIKNGDVRILKDFTQNIGDEMLKTRHSQLFLSQNLNFYSHKSPKVTRPNLLRVRELQYRYFSRIRQNVALEATAKNPHANCYIFFKNAESLQSKSTAVVLNLDDGDLFDGVAKVYFYCK